MSFEAYFCTYSAAPISNVIPYPAQMRHTLDFRIVAFRLSHEERGRLAVQRIGWVGISEKLRDEDLEDVDHVVHR